MCSRLKRLDVFQAPLQFERGNYTTATSEEQIADAACATPQRLEGGPLFAVPGFPGLFAIAAGGHTPGSTAYLARVGDTAWMLAGDVSNEQANLLGDVPKPLLYSLLITPEHRGRLGQLRRWLAALDARPDVRVVVSHDVTAIREAGMEAYVAP